MSSADELQSLRLRYLDLLKRILTRLIAVDEAAQPTTVQSRTYEAMVRYGTPWFLRLARGGRIPDAALRRIVDPAMRLARRFRPFDPRARAEGRDWPRDAETMIGPKRLQNIQDCVVDAIESNVPGDLIETGVWRGGATIFMAAILRAYGDQTRRVWVADSFAGLPRPNPARAAADAGDPHYALSGELAVSQEQVRANFRRYHLLSDQICFLPGWFKDTLPSAPIERLAVMRLDGDLYESTMDALEALYPKLSPGGYVIVDDYNALANCRAAVTDYRQRMGIADPIVAIDWSGVYWKRSG